MNGQSAEGVDLHWAGEVDGKWTISDVWESREAYDAFAVGRCRPAVETVAPAAGMDAERDSGRSRLRSTISSGPRPHAIRCSGSRPSRTASTESATRLAIASRAVLVAEPTWGRRTQLGASRSSAGTSGSFS